MSKRKIDDFFAVEKKTTHADSTHALKKRIEDEEKKVMDLSTVDLDKPETLDLVTVLPALMQSAWRVELRKKRVFDSISFRRLCANLHKEYKAGRVIYPPLRVVFAGIHLNRFDRIRCAIVTQDPYIKKGQANGLPLSVHAGTACPPSLREVLHEIRYDMQQTCRERGVEWTVPDAYWTSPEAMDLTFIYQQGVFGLNGGALTVREGESGSHVNKAFPWSCITQPATQLILDRSEHVFLFEWGDKARDILSEVRIDLDRHYVFSTKHPSPLAKASKSSSKKVATTTTVEPRRPFQRSRPFSACNDWFVRKNLPPIQWVRDFIYPTLKID